MSRFGAVFPEILSRLWRQLAILDTEAKPFALISPVTVLLVAAVLVESDIPAKTELMPLAVKGLQCNR